MKITTRKTFFLSLILVLATGGALLGAPPRNASFQWKKVPGAIQYRVQIARLDEKILIRRNTDTPYIAFRLPYGRYKARVAAVNRFRKTSPWSKWFIFVIKRSLKPEFDSADPQDISPEDGTVEVTVKGDNFMEGIKVKLIKDGKEVKEIPFLRKSETRIILTVNSGDLPGGYLDLAIINPGDNSITAKQVFQITANPEVDDVSPGIISFNSGPRKVTVSGKRFLKGCSVFFRKGSKTIRPSRTIRKNSRTLELTIDPTGATGGSYDMVIMNPGNNNAITSDSLRISKNMGIYIGISPVFAFSGIFDSHGQGPQLGTQLHAAWKPGLFETIPVVNKMGIEGEYIYLTYNDEVSNSFGIGFTFTFEPTSIFNIIFHSGFGGVYSVIKDTVLGNLNSTDPYVYIGTSLRFNIADMIFIETGLQYYNLFYISRNQSSLMTVLRFGIIF